MKNLNILVWLCFASQIGAQQLIIVSNQASDNPRCNSIMEAIEIASPGDTLYIKGSSIEYTEVITINKKLHIIGPGFKDTDKNYSAAESSRAVVHLIIFEPGGQESTIEGIEVKKMYHLHKDGSKIRNNLLKSYPNKKPLINK